MTSASRWCLKATTARFLADEITSMTGGARLAMSFEELVSLVFRKYNSKHLLNFLLTHFIIQIF